MNLTDEQLDELSEYIMAEPLLDREIKEFRFCSVCSKPYYHRSDYDDFCTLRCEETWLYGN